MELFYIIAGIWILYSRTWIGKNRHYHIIDDNVRRWGYLYDVPQTSPPPEFYSTKPHPWRHFFLILTHSLNVWVIHSLFGWQVAALFAFSPISVNGTAWITGGYYAVTMFLSLTSYFFLVTFPNVFGVLAANMFFAAALGSTITCIGVPLVFFFAGNPIGLTFFWPLAFYLGGKRFRTGYGIRNAGKTDTFTLRKIPVMTKVLAYYMRINLFPNKLSFFREYGRQYTNDKGVKEQLESYNARFWYSLAGIVAFVAVGWQFSPLGVAWFVVTLLPFTQFKILGQFIAERYLYLPQLGIYMIIAGALGQYPIAMAIILTAYIYRTHIYIPSFRKIETLYKNGIVNYPKCVSNYANLGERYLHRGQTHRARRLLEHGLTLEPKSFLCHCNLAAYWISVKGWEMALYHTSKAVGDDNNPMAKKILHKQYTDLKNLVAKRRKDAEDTDIRKDAGKKQATESYAKVPLHALPKQSAIQGCEEAEIKEDAESCTNSVPV
jgi:tetratricopeptide (TPR) repeat protein